MVSTELGNILTFFGTNTSEMKPSELSKSKRDEAKLPSLTKPSGKAMVLCSPVG